MCGKVLAILMIAFDDVLEQQLQEGDVGADVRLHWGQLIPAGTLELPAPSGESRVRASYPQYDAWRRQRDSFDPAGRGLNPWQVVRLP